MEIFLVSMLLLLVLFVTFTLQILLYCHSKSHVPTGKLPPGKTGLPFLGESIEFLSAGRKGHPEKFILDRIAKYSSQVFKTSLFGQTTAIVCGPTSNKFLFSNENMRVQAWWPKSVNKIFPSSLQTSSEEEAKKMRKMLPGFLKPEALQKYIGIMDHIAQIHFKSGWENKHEITVFPLVKQYTFQLACHLFLSIEDPEHVAMFADPFVVLSSGIISIPIDLPGTPFNRAVKASSLIRRELRAVIKRRKIDLAEKKVSLTQDILSHMLLTTDENGHQYMNEMDIAGKILGLLIGGHDTASAAIPFIVKYLAELPEVYNEVLKEQMEIAKLKAPGELLNWDDIKKMRYSWNEVCEVLRLASPVQGAFREALNDFIYAGFSIPKGWKIFLMRTLQG